MSCLAVAMSVSSRLLFTPGSCCNGVKLSVKHKWNIINVPLCFINLLVHMYGIRATHTQRSVSALNKCSYNKVNLVCLNKMHGHDCAAWSTNRNNKTFTTIKITFSYRKKNLCGWGLAKERPLNKGRRAMREIVPSNKIGFRDGVCSPLGQ